MPSLNPQYAHPVRLGFGTNDVFRALILKTGVWQKIVVNQDFARR